MLSFMLVAIITVMGASVEHDLRSYSGYFDCKKEAFTLNRIIKDGVTSDGTKVRFICETRRTTKVKI